MFNGSDEPGKRQYLAGPQGKFVLDLGAKRAQAERALIGGLVESRYAPLAESLYYGGGN